MDEKWETERDNGGNPRRNQGLAKRVRHRVLSEEAMKANYRALIPMLFFSASLYLPASAAAQQQCYFHWGASSGPWGGNCGPFSSYAACTEYRSNYQRIQPAMIMSGCTCSGSAVPAHKSGGSSSASGANSSDQAERELEERLRNTRAAEEKAKAEAERQREFDDEKNSALRAMKGLYSNDDELRDAGGDSSELKPAAEVDGSGSLGNPSGLKPATEKNAGQMAAICSERARLRQRQSELAQEVDSEYYAIRTLQQSFQRDAANSTYWGNLYGTVHGDNLRINEGLAKLDPLTKVLKFAKIPDPNVPVEKQELPLGLGELDSYVTIAKDTAKAADAITGFVASGKVHGIDQSTENNLIALRTLSARFARHLRELRQTSASLASQPMCDSTRLVVQ